MSSSPLSRSWRRVLLIIVLIIAQIPLAPLKPATSSVAASVDPAWADGPEHCLSPCSVPRTLA